ncbi:hypothetical protein HYE67_008206 [Fusarium culmorum]|uniref:Uncharacterized protein n=1 Tax=Fusarium culmorum TaxID=5516 RepID=A0A2T4HAQ3_FUSCU|nr:hypothetical protein FCULG_00002892 [Fusarium culmorum]QPC65975.1 hypothetical protein HYE67_008206 [Fusarium culmorum]
MPGLIRRLITPQRSQQKTRQQPQQNQNQNQNRNGGDLSDSCEDLSSCCAKKSTQRRTNTTKSRLPVPKKSSAIPTPVTIQRVPEIHRVANPVPVPALPTPRLRAPSVSSSRFEGRNAALEALTGSDATNRGPAYVLCPVEHGQSHLHSYHHSHSSQSSRHLRPPRSRNGNYGSVNNSSSHHERVSPEASVLSLSDHGADVYEAEPTSWQPEQPVYDGQSLGSSSDSVDRLFRETDEAFKALGSALRETQRASQLSNLPPPPSPPGIPTQHKHSKSMPLPAGFQKHSRWRGEESSSISSHRSSPDRRISVVKKPQRKKQSFVGQSFSKAATLAPRWTLSENMADILTGQRFRRIEADEMLTPDRIEALRRKREAAQQLDDERAEERARERHSIDSIRSDASDNSETDVEPFHLDELASRIRARQAAENTAVPVDPTLVTPELTPDLDSFPLDILKNKPVVEDSESIRSVQDKSDVWPDTWPQLPVKNPARAGTETIDLPPSIPEVLGDVAAKLQPKSLSDEPAADPPKPAIEETDEYYYLKSTPYTLTKPSFRHGPITLAKAEVEKGIKKMDDTLDWTAFQMAILGGAGDLFQDMSVDEDTKQVEEITSWFDTFGFETYGVLVPGDVPEPEPEPEAEPAHVHAQATPSLRSSSHSTFSSTPSTIDTDIDLPIPVGAEFPSGFWNAPAPGQDLDKAKFFNSTGLKRWVGEGRPKRPTSYSEDEESLPPSPMMPLVVHMSVGEADIPDTVPMGYNLHHDLGDFLKWEAENVYASRFSKSP